eukprot:IDg15693t1
MAPPRKNGTQHAKSWAKYEDEIAPSGPSTSAQPKQSSAGYAERLSCGHHRGLLNLKGEPDAPLAIKSKVSILARLIKNAKCVIVHTGAGLSTAAGINDFRGPEGIWTKEVKKMNSNAEQQSNYPQLGRDKSSSSDTEESVLPAASVHENGCVNDDDVINLDKSNINSSSAEAAYDQKSDCSSALKAVHEKRRTWSNRDD